ncbi:MAG: MmgE/PrpD family protein, partial [Betaproteobacteria bacterium]
VHMEKINRGAGERALSEDDIVQKYHENAQLVISAPRAQHIQEIILNIENHSAREIASLLAGQ